MDSTQTENNAEPAPKMELTTTAWSDFEVKTINPTAGDLQRKEMKTAFYAGSLATLQHFQLIRSLATNPEEYATAIYELQMEIQEFFGVNYLQNMTEEAEAKSESDPDVDTPADEQPRKICATDGCEVSIPDDNRFPNICLHCATGQTN